MPASSPRSAPPSPGLSARYRVGVFSRVVATLFAGYFVAYASTALLTVILPMERINRVVTATLLSFVIWCAGAIWAFAARSAWRGWWPLLLAGALMMAAAWLFRDAGARP